MDPDNQHEIILKKIISFLNSIYGQAEWWPGDCDSIIIGAVLAQQTRWENVEKALLKLDEAGIRTIEDLRIADDEVIMDAVRCTGYYRLKTGRLKNLSEFVESMGGVCELRNIPPGTLRRGLLDVKGIGPETADSILCYGLDMPSYVIDLYTVRIAGCAGIDLKNEQLKELFEKVLPGSADMYKKCHGWFVEYAKEYCVKKRCEECRIRSLN